MEEALYSSGEPEVPLRHATLAMGLNRELDRGVPDVYVGVMLFFLRYLGYVIDELDSSHESLELEGLRDEVSLELPAVEFLQFRFDLRFG